MFHVMFLFSEDVHILQMRGFALLSLGMSFEFVV